MTAPQRIRYRFDLPDGTARVLDFEFTAREFQLTNAVPEEPPFWAELDFNRCPNCPLDAAAHRCCPPALHMADAVEKLQALVSFDAVDVAVDVAGRRICARTSVQEALSSVLGLIMATAGCPWTDRLRPMARFHLPFADETETVYRSVSMYLLAAQVVGMRVGSDFAQLEDLYRNLHLVNRHMARRLGAATQTDPARNAIALLDVYTALLPAALENSLADLEPLFAAWRGAPTAAI
ncbi:MAG: hypothetical protein KGL92_00480 [Gammaproteobacteria bacterium]|nr:hypothetical protein [Gammaproteobacteria bacterium]MDE2346953.1 hypothetical protein [Gammaproteobacteria bacterium]